MGLIQIQEPLAPSVHVQRISEVEQMGPICLIIPPSLFLLDDRVFMTLGILKVAAVLEREGVKVDMLDLSGIKNFEEVVSDYMGEYPDVKRFGLTSTTPQMPAATKILKVIKQKNPHARVILGGPHITLINAAYKNEIKRGVVGRAHKEMMHVQEVFDVLVAGDGEGAVFGALKEYSPRLIDADDKKSELFMSSSMLETLPLPARHLVDVGSYHYSIDGFRALSLIAQLGCPYRCKFCGGRLSDSLRKIRTRSSQLVVDEMVHLWRTYGVTGFMLYDDELNVSKNMLELMELITQTQRDLGVEWRLRGFIKSELFTQQQADAMYRAGFRWILTGFESGSPQILKAIDKNATREENTRCVEFARKAGLKVKALMSIGHPGETEETIEETRKWLLEVKPDDFDVSIITCYPGTPYYDEAEPHPHLPGVWVYTYKGDTLYQIEVDYNVTADYYKGDPNGGYRAYVYTDTLKPEDLVRLRDFIERDVRKKLCIPFNPSASAVSYEHSMGQTGIPHTILRRSR